jgi:hypothetical protein
VIVSNTTERHRDHITPVMVHDHAELLDRYLDIRLATERLCAPLATEDYVVQAMPDASPTKWHLAHTGPTSPNDPQRERHFKPRITARLWALLGLVGSRSRPKHDQIIELALAPPPKDQVTEMARLES